MEKLIKMLVIVLVLMTSCKTSRKIAESTVSKSNEKIEVNTSVLEKKDLNVQKDLQTDLEITTEETVTEFYVPVKDSSTKSETIYLADKGAVKAIRTIKTTTKKKEADNSKIEDKGQKQENSQQKKEGEAEFRSQKSDIVKRGVAQWKIIVVVVVVFSGGIFYLLIRKKIIEIPILTRLLKWLKSLF